ncbi:MAG: serine hydrolase domain-containing protein [Daejeonella sp.]
MYTTDRFLKAGSAILIAAVVCILSASACAQPTEHRNNEKYLNEQKSIAQSTVLLNNSANIVPLRNIEGLKIASVNIGSPYSNVFDSILNKYALVKSFSATAYNSGANTLDDLSDDLKFYNTIVIQVTEQSLDDPNTLFFILDNQKNKQIILSLAGDAGKLKLLDAVTAPIIWSEKSSAEYSDFAAQLIFGGVAGFAKLRQNISAKYTSGSGFATSAVRLKYTVPEEAGLSITDLKGIDDIAAEAIREKATPSIAVMVVKDGKVIFNKASGTHTYIDPAPSKITDIYDLASVTKTSATTMAVMRLFEQGKIKLDTNVGAYIPKARKTDKNDIAVRELMLHQAGLVPYIPFYRNLTSSDYRLDSSAAYPTKVSDNYFLRKGYFEQVMWPQMLSSKLANRGKYVYSDLSMYFMREIVERQSGEHLENYVTEQFYLPLGMTRAGFNPRRRFDKDQIIPTQDDKVFRKVLLEGYVHDEGAAMAGGVSGHAGLFASANDLAILYQMLLNKGSYGGVQYFKPETVEMFTSNQSNVSRRGLGFDRWDPDSTSGYPSKLASPQTYGHTGYTGTCVWVDPKYNLVYIFLSNRVNPEVSNKLSDLSIRGRIQDVIYEAILK